MSNWGWQSHSPSKGIEEEKQGWGKDNRLRVEYAESETPEEKPSREKILSRRYILSTADFYHFYALYLNLPSIWGKYKMN